MTINNVGVIGAGTMGNGIAQICALKGLTVTMVDINDAAVQKGIATIAGSLDRLIKKGTLSAAEKDAALAHIHGSLQLADLKAVDIAIEAATENIQIKTKMLKELDQILNPGAIIATNTSSISITKLAAATSRSDRFIGMHFFNPVPLMGLVEVISGLQTTDATRTAVEDLAKRLGKTPINVKNRPGFVVNRVLVPMINEAVFALEEGLATAKEIDDGMKLGCNHPLGPLALADLIGLDTVLSIMNVFYDGFNDPKYRPAPMLKEMVDAGFLGRKTKHGFYTYP